jgi:hypothetical protein
VTEDDLQSLNATFTGAVEFANMVAESSAVSF